MVDVRPRTGGVTPVPPRGPAVTATARSLRTGPSGPAVDVGPPRKGRRARLVRYVTATPIRADPVSLSLPARDSPPREGIAVEALMMTAPEEPKPVLMNDVTKSSVTSG